jgi:hypothetical protein
MKLRPHPLLFLAASTAATALLAGDGWIELFDGETLDGWIVRGGEATYAVHDEAIVGTNGPGHNTFLCTTRVFGDFELEFEVRLPGPLNSGVQIRSRALREKTDEGAVIERVAGPQVEIERGVAEAGYLYGERAGGWMTPEADRIPHDAFRDDDWNHYRIVAEGPRFRTWVNGRKISDLVDEGIHARHREGFIGLQVHSTGAPTGTLGVAWRNLRLRELDGAAWKPLFNGRDLSGWTPKVTGYPLGENPGNLFRVEDGVLKVRYDAFERFAGEFGHLFHADSYSHYRFRMEYRFVGEQTPGGPSWAYRNSGVMVHGQAPETMALGQDFPDSIEVQLLGAAPGIERPTGNLCTPATHVFMDGDLVTRHCLGSSSRSYPGDQWVRMEITVRGNEEIIHYINGNEVLRYQMPHLDDGTMLHGGTLSLQAESHGCEFRAIELKSLRL